VQARVCFLCFRGSVRTKLQSVTSLKTVIFVVTAAITPNAAGIRTLICCCVHVFPLDPHPTRSRYVMLLQRLRQIVLFIALLFRCWGEMGLLCSPQVASKKIHFSCTSSDSSVGLPSRLQDGQLKNRRSIPSGGMIFFSL